MNISVASKSNKNINRDKQKNSTKNFQLIHKSAKEKRNIIFMRERTNVNTALVKKEVNCTKDSTIEAKWHGTIRRRKWWPYVSCVKHPETDRFSIARRDRWPQGSQSYPLFYVSPSGSRDSRFRSTIYAHANVTSAPPRWFRASGVGMVPLPVVSCLSPYREAKRDLSPSFASLWWLRHGSAEHFYLFGRRWYLKEIWNGQLDHLFFLFLTADTHAFIADICEPTAECISRSI